MLHIPVFPFPVRRLARRRKRAHKSTTRRKHPDELRADRPRIRPKIECVQTEDLVEALFPKRQGSDIAAHKEELAARDSHPITPHRRSEHRWGEIHARDTPLVCLRHDEGETASRTKPDFEHAIRRLNMEDINAPIRLGGMLPTHTFTDNPANETGWIAMLLIYVG